MRSYKCNDKIYNGFESFAHESQLQKNTPNIIVMCWFDGEIELWICDTYDAIYEIAKYYNDEWSPGRLFGSDIPYKVFTS